jgi:CRP/FNR family cyclic AMP-dependent transcriptional regulator
MRDRLEAIDICRLLAEDRDLAEAIGPELRERAGAELTARVLRIPHGSWAAPEPPDEHTLGLLVLSGVLVRRVEIERRSGIELIGEGDLIRPWQEGEAGAVHADSDWMALAPARMAWLDEQITRRLARYPGLNVRLVERTVRRSRQLTANLAIVHQPRVDARLLLVLWQLAGRWGRVRRDGVMVPVRLTHSLLADLVAARRPTVTSALSQLSRRGVLRQLEDGWLLRGSPPALANAGAPPVGVLV